MPLATSRSRTASARCCDSLRLSSSLPRLSEWPSISTLRSGYVLRNSASLSMLRCAPGPTLVLPASKSTSPIVSTRPRSVCYALRLASSFASAAPLACSAARACASASRTRASAASRTWSDSKPRASVPARAAVSSRARFFNSISAVSLPSCCRSAPSGQWRPSPTRVGPFALRRSPGASDDSHALLALHLIAVIAATGASRAVAARFGRTDDGERMRLRPGDLVQIPLRVADHVVLALRGVGPGRERGRAHAGLVLLAQVPVLDARELPKRQQRVERVVFALDGVLVDEPLHLYARRLRARRRQARRHGVIAARVVPEVRHRPHAQRADVARRVASHQGRDRPAVHRLGDPARHQRRAVDRPPAIL